MFIKFKKNKKPLQWRGESGAGFTTIEIIIVILILAVLSTIVIGYYAISRQRADVDTNIREFATVLTLAQNTTLDSELDSQYGVYVDTASSPDRYILFKGATHATRDAAFDQVTTVSKTVEFGSINLAGQNEVVFDKLTGAASPAGDVSLRLVADTVQLETVYISSAGVIATDPPVSPSDSERVQDSRHVHFDYVRPEPINTATENVILTFNGNIVETIPIISNMQAGQIYWSGTVSAGGTDQTVTIRTHRLNDSGTEFSIHRDKRFNDKTLMVQLSGYISDTLIQYSADGLTTTSPSIYVSNI